MQTVHPEIQEDRDTKRTSMVDIQEPQPPLPRTAQPEPVNTANISSKPAKPNQTRALFRKSLSFQKRQWFTNICCVTLCPIIMVVLAAVLGSVILMLIQSSSPIVDILYCANENSMNYLNFPYLNHSDPRINKVEVNGIKDVIPVNYFMYTNLDLRVQPSATSFIPKQCVQWLGPNYPYSAIYEQKPTLARPYSNRDSTYLVQVVNGWIDTLKIRASPEEYLDYLTTLNYFSQSQLRPWSLIVSPLDPSVLGSGTPANTTLNLFQLNATSADLFTQASSTIGLFDTFDKRYFVDYSVDQTRGNITINGFQQVPYNRFLSASDDDEGIFADLLKSALTKLTALGKGAIFRSRGNGDNQTTTAGKQSNYYNEANKILQAFPYGTMYIDKLDYAAQEFKWTLQYGSDKRVSAASSFPSPGLRRMIYQTQLDNAILRFSNLTSTNQTRMAITQGVRSFPILSNTKLNIPFSGLIGRILFPFGVSFLLPIFVVILVREKEERIFVMMKLNGMGTMVYAASQYLTFYALFAISSLFFLIAGLVTKLDLVAKTEFSVLVITFLVWGFAQISLAFFFASFFSKSRSALVIVFLIVLCGVTTGSVIEQLFDIGAIPVAYFIWPPFAFYRALSTMNQSAYNPKFVPYKLKMLTPGDEVFNSVIALAIEAIVFMLLAYYNESVSPSEFGVSKKWNFPFTDILALFSKKNKENAEKKVGLKETFSDDIDETTLALEDEDVKNERVRVDTNNYDPNSPLVMKHMKKAYAPRAGLGEKLAVRDVSIAVEEGVVFGLLGPNGAGKTTLISILTGLYQTTSGEATISGYNIKTQQNLVNGVVGICPQFDILWDDLTVSEHLYFYCRLKGVSKAMEKERVQDSLRKVSLEPFADRLTKGLSGGEKRRLSIAIALVGNPNVLFLDEPTTGLDPEVRRLIWDIVNTARAGKTIVLTTHSMVEAEALCQRIGIMSKGSLRCLANPLRLKKLYGSGFKLFFNSLAENTTRASEFVETLLPEGFKKLDSFTTNTSYEFVAADGVLPKLFVEMEKRKQKEGILDWGVSQTTLEEVFLRLISEEDAQG